MKCPHCLVAYHDNPTYKTMGGDMDGIYQIVMRRCSECEKVNLEFKHLDISTRGDSSRREIASSIIRPKVANRPPVPKEVPAKYRQDYYEACLVIADSPKASAALSRRCLQNILREELKISKKDLAPAIDEIIIQGKLPSDLLDSIDAIRNIGNFAAHPLKSKFTGEILEVEPGEAEWNIEVLELLFDYLFVRPTIIAKKKEALNKKLKDAGKPEMK